MGEFRFPIIGIDFLKHFRLNIDSTNSVLVPSAAAATSLSCNSVSSPAQTHQTAATARSYAEVAAALLWPPPGTPLPPAGSWQAIVAKFPAVTASAWQPGQPAHGM
jgi:hypothetical protein